MSHKQDWIIVKTDGATGLPIYYKETLLVGHTWTYDRSESTPMEWAKSLKLMRTILGKPKMEAIS